MKVWFIHSSQFSHFQAQALHFLLQPICDVFSTRHCWYLLMELILGIGMKRMDQAAPWNLPASYMHANMRQPWGRNNKKLLRWQVVTHFYGDGLFNNIDMFQTQLTFNELWTSTVEIQVNSGKYIIKHNEVFICELNCFVHEFNSWVRKPLSIA